MSETRTSASSIGTWTTVGLAALLILVSVLYVKVRAERDEARSGSGAASPTRPDAPDRAAEQLAAVRSDLAAQAAQAKLAGTEHAAALAGLTKERDALAAELEQAKARLAAVRGERDLAQRSIVDLEDDVRALEITLARREREVAGPK